VPTLTSSNDEFLSATQAALSAAAAKRPVALLIGTLDARQRLTELHGRSYVDDASDTVAQIAHRTLRDEDILGRGDDDRILMMLPGVSADDALSVGERLCAAVRMHMFADVPPPSMPRVTLSIGVALAPEHGASYENVFAAADAARCRIAGGGADGAAIAPLAHHEVLHRPLGIDRFAGRKDDLAALVRWLTEAATGEPRLVLIEGEPGVGTAALTRQLKPEVRLRGGAMVSASTRAADVPEPYGVWASVVAGLSRLPGAPARQWRELQHLVPATDAARGEAHTGSQYRLLEELTDYVRSSASARPLVLVLDEMQLADATSWDALEHLVGQLSRDRLMICVATRPDATRAIAQRREALARHSAVRQLSLSCLTRDEVKQWLEGAFHRQEVGREFLAFLYRHTEGNPFFIVQLLRALVEDGALWHSGARWEWRAVSELRLPAGLKGLIAQRINRFSSSTQAVLSIASVIGREFDLALLAASGAGSDAAVKLAISEVVAAGLVRRTYERSHHGYAFAHSQIADVLYDSIPRDRRQQLHNQVARALERGGAGHGEIASHYDRGGTPAAACQFAQRAARDAERLYALHAANGYLHMAARNATSPAELAEVRVKLAQLAETGGRFDEVEELCDLAIDWFDGRENKARALSLRAMRQRARIQLGEPAPVALDALLALDAQAKELGFDRERVAILTTASLVYERLGDLRTAEGIARHCVEMAERISDRPLLGDALIRLGTTMLSEAPGRARMHFERALELFEAIGDVRGQARCHGNIGAAAHYESRLDEAADAYSRSMAVARAAGMPDLWGITAMNLAVLSQRSGEYDRARELLGDALALFAAIKHSEYQLIALYNLAHIERECGLWDSAIKLYEATIPLAQRIGKSDIEIGAIAALGICSLELARAGDARAALETIAQRMKDRPHWFQGRELVEALMIRLSALDGDGVGAVERLDAALALAEAVDVYSAAWLAAACADSLSGHQSTRVGSLIGRYATRVKGLGYPEMTRRYDALTRT